MKPLVLISSEDADFYLLINHVLEKDGFATLLGGSVEETYQLAAENVPHAIVFDCRPNMFSGSEACSRLKRDPLTSGIVTVALIGRGAESQHVDLLQAGVDESFVRPMAPVKLLEFLRAKLSNNGPIKSGINSGSGVLNYADIEVNLNTFCVHRNGVKVHLGPIEFRILGHFLQHPGQVFSREELISAAWPDNIFVDGRTVDVHIAHLRRSLKSDTGAEVIRTVRSAGYVLDGEPVW